MRNAHKLLIRKGEGNRQPGKPRRKWEQNIKMDLKGTEWEGVAWINLA
jgi:hypothetical protein